MNWSIDASRIVENCMDTLLNANIIEIKAERVEKMLSRSLTSTSLETSLLSSHSVTKRATAHTLGARIEGTDYLNCKVSIRWCATNCVTSKEISAKLEATNELNSLVWQRCDSFATDCPLTVPSITYHALPCVRMCQHAHDKELSPSSWIFCAFISVHAVTLTDYKTIALLWFIIKMACK